MTEGVAAIWRRMLADLREHHPGVCRQWFEQIEPMRLEGGVLGLRAASGVHRSYLERECTPLFSEAAQNVTGHLMSVQFFGPDDRPPVAGERPGAPGAPGTTANGVDGVVEAKDPRHNGHNGHAPAIAATPKRPRAADELAFNPDYTFENFVVGPNNRLAHAASLAISDNPGRTYNPMFIQGDVGLGKTHLLQAVCLRILENNPDAAILYIPCEAFVNRFMEAVQAGQMSGFRHEFRDVDVLVIDDIHFLAKRERTQEEFFHTFNTLYQSDRQIILSSDAPPDEIPHLEKRLISRFKWGLVTKIDAPDYDTRVAIVKQKAEMRGLKVPTEVASVVATEIDTNIRELEGALTRLEVHARVAGREIDLPIARQALGVSERPIASVTIETIVEAVTGFYSVTLSSLQSKRRQRSIAQPRQVCMYLARRFTRYSLEEIGGYFGGRDHTTVLHAVRTITAQRDRDPAMDRAITTIEQKLRLR